MEIERMQQAESEIKRTIHSCKSRLLLNDSLPLNAISVMKAGDILLAHSPTIETREALEVPEKGNSGEVVEEDIQQDLLLDTEYVSESKEEPVVQLFMPKADSDDSKDPSLKSYTGPIVLSEEETMEKIIQDLLWEIISKEVVEKEGRLSRGTRFPTSASQPLLYTDSLFPKELIWGWGNTNRGSVLTALMLKRSTEEDYILPEPPAGDRSRFFLRVYLFATSKYLDLVISKHHTVEEVIKHVISICLTTSALKRQFFESLGTGSVSRTLTNPELYELRLLDDDEDEYYLPLYDIAPLNKGKCIGSFGADVLAFCRVRGTHLSSSFISSGEDTGLDRSTDEGILLKIYYCEGQKVNAISLTVSPDKTLKEVLKEISKIRGEELKESLYSFETYNPFRRQFTESDMLQYKALMSGKILDMYAPVKTLATNEIQLIDKTFCDISGPGSWRRSTMAVNYFSPQVMQIQKEVEEVKKKKRKVKKDEKKEYEYIYNKLTATNYDEYKGYHMNFLGKKKPAIIAIDVVNLYCFKRSPKKTKPVGLCAGFQDKEKICVIPLKSIVQVERAIYDDKKLYIWYYSKKEEKLRVVFEMEETVYATEILAKIKFICKRSSNKNLNSVKK